MLLGDMDSDGKMDLIVPDSLPGAIDRLDTRCASAVAQKLWRDRRRAAREMDALSALYPG